jgi:hypothetical protein
VPAGSAERGDDNPFIFRHRQRVAGQNRPMATHSAAARACRAVLATALACAGLLIPAGAAVAHGAGQPVPDAAYYRTQLTAVDPTPAGVVARVDPGGEWVEVAATGPVEVLVLGYTREPYLRVKAGQVFENQLSQTTYLNRSLFADSVPASEDGGTVAPVWKQIGSGGRARWHDHRIHWMGQARPPAVAADPGHPHPVGTWTVHATADGVPFQIRGTLSWLGKPEAGGGLASLPQWVLWLVESMVVVIGVLVLVVVAQRRRLRVPAGPPGEVSEEPAEQVGAGH